MNRIIRMRKAFEQVGEYVSKFQAAGKEFDNFLRRMDIPVENLGEFIEEFSQNLYEDTRRVTYHNSQYGWTLAGSIKPLQYIDDTLLKKTKDELDTYFYEYFSENDWDEYKDLKADILKHLDPKWTRLINDCFFLFENHRHQAAIPVLFSIIEGELANLLESDKYSGKLVKEMETKAEGEAARFRKMVMYSVLTCFQKGIFVGSSFSGERKEVINRHWVLHGRDVPSLWEETDVLRLLTVLGSIQFIRFMTEE